MITLFGYLALSASILGTAVFASVPTTPLEIPLNGVRTIEVINPAGDIKYSGTPKSGTSKAKITLDATQFAPQCELVHARHGDTLTIEMKSSNPEILNHCKGALAVEALQIIKVRLQSGNGNLSVAHVSSPLEFEIGNGAFRATDVTSTDLRGSVGNGNIELAYTEAPRRAHVSLGTGNGDVKIKLPAGTAIDIDQEAGVGQLINPLGNTPNAPIQIHVQSGVGKTEIIAVP